MIGFSIMQSHLWKKLLKPLFADTLRNLKRICLLSHWQPVVQFFHIRIMVFFSFFWQWLRETENKSVLFRFSKILKND